MFNKKLVKKIIGLVWVISFLSFNSFSANISIIPSEDIVRNGSTVKLNIIVSELSGEILSGFDLYIKYDPVILSLVNYEITDAIGRVSEGEVKNLSSDNSSDGIINIAAISLVYDIPLQSDPLTISNINMKVIQGESIAKIDIIDPLLISYYGDMVPVGNIYGAILNTVPEPSIFSLSPFVIISFVIIGIVKRENLHKKIKL